MTHPEREGAVATRLRGLGGEGAGALDLELVPSTSRTGKVAGYDSTTHSIAKDPKN